MSARYSYDRARTANLGGATSYGEAIDKLRQEYTALVAERLHQCVTKLHRQLAASDPWDAVGGFQKWNVRTNRMGNAFQALVWQTGVNYPDEDVDPTLNVFLKFGDFIQADVWAGERVLFKRVFKADYSASDLAQEVGDAWERLLLQSASHSDDHDDY